jgi:hypothetical protein
VEKARNVRNLADVPRLLLRVAVSSETARGLHHNEAEKNTSSEQEGQAINH